MYTYTMDGIKLYDPMLTAYTLERPTMRLEGNKIGTLEFTVYPTNPRFNDFKLNKSIIRVYSDGELVSIFRPARRNMTLRGGVEYTCEEMTAQLNDVLRRPKAFSGTAADLMDECAEGWMVEASTDYVPVPKKTYIAEVLSGFGSSINKLYMNNDIGSADDTWYYREYGTHIYTYGVPAIETLSRAMALLGYMGRGYLPPNNDKLRYYPYNEVNAYIQAKGLSQYGNGTIWREVGPHVYPVLLQDMQDLYEDTPDEPNDPVSSDIAVTFSVGATPASGPTFELEADEYAGYWDFLQEKIVNVYGGYIVPTWSENNCTLNYYNEGDLPQSEQKIVFGENLADLFVETDASEAYTALIPVGKDGITIKDYNRGNDYLLDPVSYAMYGRKEIIKSWDEVETAAELYSTAVQWMADHGLSLKRKITATAYDLALAGVNVSRLKFMTNVRVISERHGLEDVYPLKAMEIVMDSPVSNLYTLGNEPESLVDALNDEKPASYVEKKRDKFVYISFGDPAEETTE